MEVPTPQRWCTSRGLFALRARALFAVMAACATLSACGRAGGGSGSVIFRSSCSGCHTLSSGAARRTPGGNLLPYRMSRTQMLAFVRQMPVPRTLSDAEVVAVSNYVLALQRGASARHAPGS